MSDAAALESFRLADSFLPVGTYTVSYGLEQFIQDDRSKTRQTSKRSCRRTSASKSDPPNSSRSGLHTPPQPMGISKRSVGPTGGFRP